jgi:GxxExxY protein
MLIETPSNRITHEILAAAIEVHRFLGPGLFERVYEPCFQYELGVRKLQFETQRVIPIRYKGMQFGATYRVDLIVEGVIVVETKCVAALLPVHDAQVLTYMKLTSCPLGLLINFNVPKLMNGVKRLVLAGHERASGPTGTRKDKRRSEIRERDPPFLRFSVLNRFLRSLRYRRLYRSFTVVS